MKTCLCLIAAFALIAPAAEPARAGHRVAYPLQFRGVCQACGHDLLARYRPVQCLDGRVEWQWVREAHRHCRPAHLGRKRHDFFNSHLMNPANPKRIRSARYAPRSAPGGCCD